MQMKKLILLLFLIPNLVMGFCSAPSEPFGGAPSKPSVPYCVNEWNNTHTCDDWTIDSYQNDLRNYQYEVERFVDDLQDYLSDAQDYVNCEIRSLD